MNELFQNAFTSGRAIRPDHTKPNFVSLVRAVAGLAGAPWPDTDVNAHELAGLIGEHDHLVFVLVDGMGTSVLSRLPEDSFLRSHQVREIQSVYPATTACATFSYTTGEHPAQHGTSGWWTYLDKYNISATTLLYIERFGKASLNTHGVTPADLWPLPPLFNRMTHDALLIQPAAFWDSTCSRTMRGMRAGAGYDSLNHAIELITTRIANATGPTYTYLYIPDIDHQGHEHGINSAQATVALYHVNTALGDLAERLSGRARMIVTADHGQIDVATEDNLTITDGDPLLALLRVPPTGGTRTAIFHVKDDCGEAFAEQFTARFGDRIALVAHEEAEAMELFGPAPFSPLARRRFGDYISIALAPVTLKYCEPLKPGEKYEYEIGHHEGMTPEEMLIPVIVI